MDRSNLQRLAAVAGRPTPLHPADLDAKCSRKANSPHVAPAAGVIPAMKPGWAGPMDSIRMRSRSLALLLSLSVFYSVIKLSFHILDEILCASLVLAQQEVEPLSSLSALCFVVAISWLPFVCLVAATLGAGTFYAFWPRSNS